MTEPAQNKKTDEILGASIVTSGGLEKKRDAGGLENIAVITKGVSKVWCIRV